MKTIIAFLSAIILTLPAYADIVPPVRWDIETGRLEPRPFTIVIRRGENVKIEPRFLSYNTPINLTNAAVEMRYFSAYNSNTFYSVAGAVQAETGRVQVAWSDALNPTNNTLVYEIRATVGTNVLARAYGSLYLLGGMVGVNTGLTARTSINWATVSQSGGVAVLTNQMGSGSSWNGTQWTFGAGSVDLSWSNLYYLATNPSNYCTLAQAAALTNGLQPSGVYLVPADTNRFVDAAITNGLGGGGISVEADPVWAAASGSVVYAEADTLQSVAERGGQVANVPVEFDVWCDLTNRYGGKLVWGGHEHAMQGCAPHGAQTFSIYGPETFYLGETNLLTLLNDLPYGISASTSSNITAGLIAPWTNQVTTQSVVQAGAVTGTPWTAEGYIDSATATNIAMAVQAQSTNVHYLTLSGTNYTLDPTLGNSFSVTNAGATNATITIGAGGTDMQRVLLMLKNVDINTTMLGAANLDYGDLSGFTVQTNIAEVTYIGLIKRPMATKWDVTAWRKGYGL